MRIPYRIWSWVWGGGGLPQNIPYPVGNDRRSHIPPTLSKGKSSTQHFFFRGYVSSLDLYGFAIFPPKLKSLLAGGFNHFETYLIKMASSSPSFGVKIPKIFESPPPTSIFQFGCCLNPKGWCISAPQTPSHSAPKLEDPGFVKFFRSKSLISDLKSLEPTESEISKSQRNSPTPRRCPRYNSGTAGISRGGLSRVLDFSFKCKIWWCGAFGGLGF